MNVPFFIARKYFFSKKKRSFINFISIISMVAICVGTMALVIILSVFNGLEDLNRQVFKSFDPDLKISSTKSKSFFFDLDQKKKIEKIKGVKFVTEVYQDKALARSKDAQMIVVIKGVDSTFEQNVGLKAAVVEGKMALKNGNRPMAFVGSGTYNVLDLRVDDYLNPLGLTYPKNQKLNVLNPEGNVNSTALEIGGVFVLEAQYDHYVYLPLEVVENLTDKIGKRTAIEITLADGVDPQGIKSQIQDILTKDLIVKDRDEQNEALLKAIKIEKLFIFIALIFIIGIASFNIFYALSMLVIDKKDDIQTLSSIGAKPSFVSKIFLFEGFIISGMGLVLGLVIGLSICFLQQKYGFVKLGMQYALVDAYPVKIAWMDIFWSVFWVASISVVASIIPAKRAVNYMLKF